MQQWRALYRQAIFEDDMGVVLVHAVQAHHAIQRRARELWRADSMGESIDLRERQELHSALYFLNLLRVMVASERHGNPQPGLSPVQN
jgi:hypothetical protein